MHCGFMFHKAPTYHLPFLQANAPLFCGRHFQSNATLILLTAVIIKVLSYCSLAVTCQFMDFAWLFMFGSNQTKTMTFTGDRVCAVFMHVCTQYWPLQNYSTLFFPFGWKCTVRLQKMFSFWNNGIDYSSTPPGISMFLVAFGLLACLVTMIC